MNAIFSVFHKGYSVPKNKLIYPILVGVNKKDIHLNTKKQIFSDDKLENIADLNPYFCELTAMYWLWKNFKQKPEEIIGLCHYRRYLIKKHADLDFIKKVRIKILNKFSLKYDKLDFYLPDPNAIIGILRDKTIILPERETLFDKYGHYYSIERHYEEMHIKEDWQILELIIKNKHPDYIDVFSKYKNQNMTCIGNMFITRRFAFDRYCEWLFPILFEFYAQTTIQEDVYQSRSVGFIAERLLNVYILKNFSEDEIAFMDLSFSY